MALSPYGGGPLSPQGHGHYEQVNRALQPRKRRPGLRAGMVVASFAVVVIAKVSKSSATDVMDLISQLKQHGVDVPSMVPRPVVPATQTSDANTTLLLQMLERERDERKQEVRELKDLLTQNDHQAETSQLRAELEHERAVSRSNLEHSQREAADRESTLRSQIDEFKEVIGTLQNSSFHSKHSEETTQLKELVRTLSNDLGDKDQKLASVSRKSSILQTQHDSDQINLQHTGDRVQELRKMLTEKDQMISESGKIIAELNKTIEEKNATIRDLQRELALAENRNPPSSILATPQQRLNDIAAEVEDLAATQHSATMPAALSQRTAHSIRDPQQDEASHTIPEYSMHSLHTETLTRSQQPDISAHSMRSEQAEVSMRSQQQAETSMRSQQQAEISAHSMRSEQAEASMRSQQQAEVSAHSMRSEQAEASMRSQQQTEASVRLQQAEVSMRSQQPDMSAQSMRSEQPETSIRSQQQMRFEQQAEVSMRSQQPDISAHSMRSDQPEVSMRSAHSVRSEQAETSMRSQQQAEASMRSQQPDISAHSMRSEQPEASMRSAHSMRSEQQADASVRSHRSQHQPDMSAHSMRSEQADMSMRSQQHSQHVGEAVDASTMQASMRSEHEPSMQHSQSQVQGIGSQSGTIDPSVHSTHHADTSMRSQVVDPSVHSMQQSQLRAETSMRSQASARSQQSALADPMHSQADVSMRSQPEQEEMMTSQTAHSERQAGTSAHSTQQAVSARSEHSTQPEGLMHHSRTTGPADVSLRSQQASMMSSEQPQVPPTTMRSQQSTLQPSAHSAMHSIPVDDSETQASARGASLHSQQAPILRNSEQVPSTHSRMVSETSVPQKPSMHGAVAETSVRSQQSHFLDPSQRAESSVSQQSAHADLMHSQAETSIRSRQEIPEVSVGSQQATLRPDLSVSTQQPDDTLRSHTNLALQPIEKEKEYSITDTLTMDVRFSTAQNIEHKSVSEAGDFSQVQSNPEHKVQVTAVPSHVSSCETSFSEHSSAYAQLGGEKKGKSSQSLSLTKQSSMSHHNNDPVEDVPFPLHAQEAPGLKSPVTPMWGKPVPSWAMWSPQGWVRVSQEPLEAALQPSGTLAVPPETLAEIAGMVSQPPILLDKINTFDLGLSVYAGDGAVFARYLNSYEGDDVLSPEPFPGMWLPAPDALLGSVPCFSSDATKSLPNPGILEHMQLMGCQPTESVNGAWRGLPLRDPILAEFTARCKKEARDVYNPPLHEEVGTVLAKMDTTQVDNRFLQAVFDKATEGRPHPTPQEIVDILSFTVLSWNGGKYLLSFQSGQPYIVCNMLSGVIHEVWHLPPI